MLGHTCLRIPISISQAEISRFIATDATFEGKGGIEVSSMLSLDGSDCNCSTFDGCAAASDACVDFGLSTNRMFGMFGFGQHGLGQHGVAQLGHLQHARFEYLPTKAQILAPVSSVGRELSDRLQERLRLKQFPDTDLSDLAPGCRSSPGSIYYVHQVPVVGFGSVIEYTMMFLARASTMGAQLTLGRASTLEWTSSWHCGDERSLLCYFNITSCCGALWEPSGELRLPRLRNPLNIGIQGYNRLGSAWLSGQLAHFFFSRFTAPTAAAVGARRSSLPSVRRGDGVIGMHIRGGDSCAARRFCPSNLSVYFERAAQLRSLYGASRVLLATDDTRAASLCASHPFGMRCDTLRIARDKFASNTFIEKRVGAHASGPLSGSAVALDMLADVDMLADCDYLVILFRSAVSRLAYALSLARWNRPQPVISMQWPWSPAYLKVAMRKAARPKRRLRGSAPQELGRPVS